MPQDIDSTSGACLRIRAFTWTIYLAAAIATAAAQTSDMPDQVTRRVRLRGADDANVKAGTEINVRNRPSDVVPPPVKTSEERPLCSITFDNQTDLFTKTYIDGRFAGTIRPFSSLATAAVPGSTLLYARAEFDDGSADAWGPIRVNCRMKYRWRLID
jgi:hypothetical protein